MIGVYVGNGIKDIAVRKSSVTVQAMQKNEMYDSSQYNIDESKVDFLYSFQYFGDQDFDLS
jgi:hypothetical protein